MPELGNSPVALVGPAALALAPRLVAAGFDLGEGGAAVIDLSGAASQLGEVRRRYTPVVGVLADGAVPGPDADALDGLVRLPYAGTDLPPLLRALIRGARDRGELQSERQQRVAAESEVLQLRRDEESELRKTKEFLERLIHATADGIVAADLTGTILLFNKGAERMTGFSAAALVGKTSVRQLYPPGSAERIMLRLRDCRAAGQEFGRMRCELLAKSGEVIPVDLSAAIVAEDGRDTATVGVFRDLREELRREAELHLTRERLEEAEKAAVVSELAGAAAHELNQPLTSVVGYSELLLRRTQENEKGREELAAILREAERMASIVKKIGRITRYETTSYVGSTRIVDLERASNPPPQASVIRDKR